jgi:hypothetical protein
MLTFLKLGHKGNLGNQLFQIASTIGLATQYGHAFCFPKWEYGKYFDFDFKEIEENKQWIPLNEAQFNYYEWNLPKGDYTLNGWLQSEKYFQNIDVKSIFKFKTDFEANLINQNKELFSKPTLLISVRRGDFVDNKDYFQLSYKYYFKALLHHFPDYEKYNIIFTSDDINYCKYHFYFLKNAYFLEGLNAIEQLCLASKFDHYIVSNSTFSWWLAKLGEKPNSTVICPIKNFDGSFAQKYDDSDYYPERWIKYNPNKDYLPSRFWKLFLKGETYKLKHQVFNLLKRSYVKIKKIIKKVLKKN